MWASSATTAEDGWGVTGGFHGGWSFPGLYRSTSGETKISTGVCKARTLSQQLTPMHFIGVPKILHVDGRLLMPWSTVIFKLGREFLVSSSSIALFLITPCLSTLSSTPYADSHSSLPPKTCPDIPGRNFCAPSITRQQSRDDCRHHCCLRYILGFTARLPLPSSCLCALQRLEPMRESTITCSMRGIQMAGGRKEL